ncbi:MAG: acyl-CoA dehydrogenase C-terminal domain-containing protein, partial [Rhodospirillales bacterium]
SPLHRQARAPERRHKAAAQAPDRRDRQFLEMKRTLARFYSRNLLPQAAALAEAVTAGGAEIAALDEAAI